MAKQMLSDDDQILITEALSRLLAEKEQAFALINSEKAFPGRYTETDFGIPKVKALIERFDTLTDVVVYIVTEDE
jgi:hypothetical protein